MARGAFISHVQFMPKLRKTNDGFVRRKGLSFSAAQRKCPVLNAHLSKKENVTMVASVSEVRHVSVILLAGGTGSRMKADRPKQFLELAGKPVVEHSLLMFGQMPEVQQLILVVDKSYQNAFKRFENQVNCEIHFAEPGNERQDSVYNGLRKVLKSASLVCVHDSARPLVTVENVREVLRDGATHGAAVLGVPSKATIKESADGEFVLRTIPRKRLWEIQTPQVVRPSLLKKGFEKVREDNLEVTDDASIVEQLGEPVKITLGEYSNIKLTTPEDMDIAEAILRDRVRS
ncbi:unnamed protein product [Agarophyton chilense]